MVTQVATALLGDRRDLLPAQAAVLMFPALRVHHRIAGFDYLPIFNSPVDGQPKLGIEVPNGSRGLERLERPHPVRVGNQAQLVGSPPWPIGPCGTRRWQFIRWFKSLKGEDVPVLGDKAVEWNRLLITGHWPTERTRRNGFGTDGLNSDTGHHSTLVGHEVLDDCRRGHAFKVAGASPNVAGVAASTIPPEDLAECGWSWWGSWSPWLRRRYEPGAGIIDSNPNPSHDELEAKVSGVMMEPWTRESLEAFLSAEGVPHDSYSLVGSHGHEGVVLDHRALRRKGSDWRETWVVFYTERGEEVNLLSFTSEDAACREVLNRLCPTMGPKET